MLVFYNMVTYRLFFHSDSAAKNLIAEEIFRTGKFFPKDWNYVNGDLFIIFGHLFILPFLPFFKNGFVLHAVSGILSAGIILGGIWLLFVVLGVSLAGRLLCMAVITTGISPYLAENLFGQVSYGAVFYLAVLQLYFVVRYLQECEAGKAKIAGFPLLALGILVFMVFFANPSRALASYALPLLSGLIFIAAGESIHKGYSLSKASRNGIVALISILVLGGILGGICHRLVLATVNNSIGASDARFLAYEGVVRNFSETIRGWLFLVGGGTTKGRAVLSRMGLYEASHLIFALGLLAVPFFLFVNIRREKSPYLSLMTVFTLVSLGIVAFFHVFTTVPDMSDPLMSSRYFAAAAVLLLMVLFVKADIWITSNNIRMAYPLILVSLLPFLATGYIVFVSPALDKSSSGGRSTVSIRSAPFDRIVAILENNKLNYGFASYWHANVISVLSNSETKIRPILLMGSPRPMRHLSSNEWYRASVHKGSTFLLLNGEEYKTINWEAMSVYLGKPERELTEANWKIIVYPFNIAGRLPGWDDQLTEAVKLMMLPDTPHQVGRLVQGENETWMEAGAGETGYLVYGPYISLAPSRYEVVFEVSTGDAGGVLGSVDVAVNGGRIIAAKDVMREQGWQHITVPFQATRSSWTYEFRVFSRGVVPIKIRSITVHKVDDEHDL